MKTMRKIEKWLGIREDTEFSSDFFYDVDMSYSDSNDTQKAFHSNLGTITVLDHLTGFGFGIRDIETGFRDLNGEFWLVSGDFDIINIAPKTVGEAIKIIKKNANNCVGKEFPYSSPEEQLVKAKDLVKHWEYIAHNNGKEAETAHNTIKNRENTWNDINEEQPKVGETVLWQCNTLPPYNIKTGMWYGKELCERNKKWGNKEREVYGKYGRWCEPAETGYVATHWMRLPKPFEK